MRHPKPRLVSLLAAAALALLAAPRLPAVEVGQKAPDFELESTRGGKLKLSDLKGRKVLINFYVLDFSPT
jgi:cytochrome oxidase Cu insertion factor (SCO1/SenC/PrrC family)